MSDASSTPPKVPGHVLQALKSVGGPGSWLENPADLEPYNTDSRRLFRGDAALVLRPRDTQQVSLIVQTCAAAGVKITPIGGRTGLAGGGVPEDDRRGVVVSLERMTRVRHVDALDNTITLDAGCVLANAQAAAAASDRLLPLSLNAEGSCTIGGNISTNAGGIQVLRYGTMRDLVLGLEVVLPNGEIWNGLRALRKDNTGYALKHLFIGAEGTLGIVTGAVLKLFPRPGEVQTAFVALNTVQDAVELLSRLRSSLGDQLTAFEIMSRFVVQSGVRHAQAIDPFADAHPWYVLLELSGAAPIGGISHLRAALLAALEHAVEGGGIADAVVAESLAQAASLWRLRESTWEGQRALGVSIRHDVSVPISAIPRFIAGATEACERVAPGARTYVFGHIGDGNIHFNLVSSAKANQEALLARTPDINRAVHDIVAELDGSISAEHGIGRLKCQEMARTKSPLELRMMRLIKDAFDPAGLCNPGHVLPKT
jgi:D-lactate dehydrogenase (cytochrome)